MRRRMWSTAREAMLESVWQAALTRWGATAAHRRPQISRILPRLWYAASISRPKEWILQGPRSLG